MRTRSVDVAGEEARPPSFHKLFFALYPQPEAAAAAWALGRGIRERWGLRGRSTPRERLHVSLNGLGRHDTPPAELIARIAAAAAQVRAAPFRIALNQVVSCKGSPRPLVLVGDEGVFGVYALRAAIHRALVAEGLARGAEHAFTPHLTLMRDPDEIPSEFVRPVSWIVHDFQLVDSLGGQGRHVALGAWPLRQ